MKSRLDGRSNSDNSLNPSLHINKTWRSSVLVHLNHQVIKRHVLFFNPRPGLNSILKFTPVKADVLEEVP